MGSRYLLYNIVVINKITYDFVDCNYSRYLPIYLYYTYYNIYNYRLNRNKCMYIKQKYIFITYRCIYVCMFLTYKIYYWHLDSRYMVFYYLLIILLLNAYTSINTVARSSLPRAYNILGT